MVLNDLKQKIIKILNESNLSIECIYFVMKDIMDEVISAYNRQLEYENAAAVQDSTGEIEEEKTETAADSQIIEKEEK